MCYAYQSLFRGSNPQCGSATVGSQPTLLSHPLDLLRVVDVCIISRSNKNQLSTTQSSICTWSFAEKVLSSRVDRVGEALRRPVADADFMAETEMS